MMILERPRGVGGAILWARRMERGAATKKADPTVAKMAAAGLPGGKGGGVAEACGE